MKDIKGLIPKPDMDLEEWLTLGIARFAVGGVGIGEIVEAWLKFPPKIPESIKPVEPKPDPLKGPVFRI